jgi:hypothetical protein
VLEESILKERQDVKSQTDGYILGKKEPPLTMSAPKLFIRYQRIYDMAGRLECEQCRGCSFIIIIIGAMWVQFVREDPTFEKQLDR